MFCPHCGTQLDDSARFCGKCGNAIAQAPGAAPQQPTYSQPAAPSVNFAAVGNLVNKFAPKNVTPKAKQAWLISMIAFAACVLFLVLGLSSSLNGQFYDIPVLGMIMGEDGREEMKDMQKDAKKDIDRFENLLDSSDLTKKQAKQVKSAIKSYKKLVKTISITNLKDTAKQVKKVEDFIGGSDGMDEIISVINTFTIIIYIFFFISLLFTVFGGLTQKSGLTITGMIFAILFLFLLGGIVWGVLAVAAYIAQLKFSKDYKKACIPVAA